MAGDAGERVVGPLNETAVRAHYDRRVPDELVDALAPGGPMHELVKLVTSPLGVEKGLDLRLRARPGHPGARATLYLGLTQVLHVHRGTRGHFKLVGQAGKSFRDQLDASLFSGSWTRSQPLASLATHWPKVMTYVRAAIEAAPLKYLSAEGRAQARLGRESSRFVVLYREVVVSFSDQSTKNAAVTAQISGVRAAKHDLATSHAWAKRSKSFGTELDALAIDQEGRLLVIEVKHGSDTAGLGWTPAQVAVYLGLMKLWVASTSDPTSVLNGMLAQYAHLGLPGATVTARAPLELRPVIAIAEPIKSAAVAYERMRQVVAALEDRGVRMPGLEIWGIDEAGGLTVCALDEL